MCLKTILYPGNRERLSPKISRTHYGATPSTDLGRCSLWRDCEVYSFKCRTSPARKNLSSSLVERGHCTNFSTFLPLGFAHPCCCPSLLVLNFDLLPGMRWFRINRDFCCLVLGLLFLDWPQHGISTGTWSNLTRLSPPLPVLLRDSSPPPSCIPDIKTKFQLWLIFFFFL